jgi:5-methylcytosine-specific restriction enzyme subunit McrC
LILDTLTIIEHEPLQISSKRSPGQKILTEEHAKALKKVEKRLPLNTFTWGHNSVKFSNHCGVINLGTLSLEILPKIYGKETEPGACRKSLIKMLIKARQLKMQRSGAASIALQKHCLLEIFILYFCEQLRTELLQGMIHQYIVRNENLTVLRGRLRIERQVTHNIVHQERMYCWYDELSVDNTHNQVIKFVLLKMSKMPISLTARKELSELLVRFGSVSDVIVNLQMIDNLHFDRSTSRFEPIFQQCRWYYLGLHPDVFVGGESCATLLFDMNKLFESYVANIFKRLAWRNDMRMQFQGPTKYMVSRLDIDKPLFLMRPDMVFLDSQNCYLSVADAKWKMLDERERKHGISQGDLYQVAGYATRYAVGKLALMYPRQKWLQNSIVFEIKGTKSAIKVIPVDVTTFNEPEVLPF